jgi:hypothetical protein
MPDSREFETILEDYTRELKPAGRCEADLVRQIASARWQMVRCARMAAALLDEPGGLRSLSPLARYETCLLNQFEHGLAMLRLLQERREPPPGPSAGQSRPRVLPFRPEPGPCPVELRTATAASPRYVRPGKRAPAA